VGNPCDDQKKRHAWPAIWRQGAAQRQHQTGPGNNGQYAVGQCKTAPGELVPSPQQQSFQSNKANRNIDYQRTLVELL